MHLGCHWALVESVKLIRFVLSETTGIVLWEIDPAALKNYTNFLHLISRSFPHSSELQPWMVELDKKEIDDQVAPKALRFITDCKHLTISACPKNWHLDLNSSSKQVGFAYAHVLTSIMGNHTLMPSNFMNCLIKNNTHGLIPSNSETQSAFAFDVLQLKTSGKSYMKRLHTFSYFAEDTMNTLHFISCGRRARSAYAFTELTNVFDKWIWFLMGISTVAMLVPLGTQSYARKTISSHLISLWKVIVEQGDPFVSIVVNPFRLKNATGAFLLSGIVLSIAYKNNNVYNMILPRKPVPYKSFSELIEDNFTIYTRNTEIKYLYSSDISKPIFIGTDLLDTTGPRREIEGHGVHIWLMSEVFSTIDRLLQYLKKSQVILTGRAFVLPQSKLQVGAIFTNGIYLYNISRVSSFLQEPVAGIIRKFQNRTAVDIHGEIKNRIQKIRLMELGKLYEYLDACDRSAVILPAHMCNAYAKKPTARKEYYLTVGYDESYSDLGWMFTLQGFVSPELVRRFKGVSESGIWRRWMILFMSSSSSK